MAGENITELWLIRHAPVIGDGRLCGARDLPADCNAPEAFAALRARLPKEALLLRSPLRRCVATADTLRPSGDWQDVPALREQSFGAWEDLPAGEVPDLGPLPRATLASHCPPGGESFADLCARVRGPLAALAGRGGDAIVVAHAGTVRAALSLALGTVAPALAFEIAPLSLTRIALLPDGSGLVREVNACCR